MTGSLLYNPYSEAVNISDYPNYPKWQVEIKYMHINYLKYSEISCRNIKILI